jgi:nucleoside-diphosphate-sugar epimerase
MGNPLARDLEHVLDHTGEVWADLAGARIFLTGGTGFFGCWLLESFTWAVDRLGLDAAITVLTRAPRAFREKAPHLAGHRAVKLACGDIRSFEFPRGGFTHVIHGATAASAALNQGEPLEMLDTIVEGTRRALDFAEACGARRFLLTSSGAVYGPQPAGMMRMGESYRGGPDPLDPRSAYAEGKRLAEWLGCAYARRCGMDFLVARGFAFTGPYLPLDIHFAIGNFIRDALAGGGIEIRGDGTAYRSYLYAADLAIWLWTILARGEGCRPYNVGSERAVSIAELAARVAQTLAPGTPIHIAAKAQPGAAANRYVPDTSRAREELGLAEWIPLEEAIRRTAAAECPAGAPL